MKNILLTISYDGTDFCGWQKQKESKTGKVRTVQEEIEFVLEKVLKQKTVIHGSGRTDSGVHAYGQAASFISPLDNMQAEKYIPALNSLLPHDIRIMSSIEVDPSFHARFSATSRTYRYFIWCSKTPPANEMRFIWPIFRFPNIDKLNTLVKCLHGEIDCTTFSAAGDTSLSKYRYINNAHFTQQGDKLIFEITANAFLWRMVRSIIGTLINAEYKNFDDNYIERILQARNRSLVGPTAPSTGLFLWNVSFEGERKGPSC